MPQLDVLDIKNNKVGGVEAAPTIFDVKIKNQLIKQYVVISVRALNLLTFCRLEKQSIPIS